MLLLLILILILLGLYSLSQKKEMYSDLKITRCRKNFDIYEGLREYMLPQEKKQCIDNCNDRMDCQIVNHLFKINLNKKDNCFGMAEKECTFNYDIPSLNTKCHSDYLNLCLNSFK